MNRTDRVLHNPDKSCATYSRRYEEEGLTGLFDKRLGKASARRVPIDQVSWMLSDALTIRVGR